MRNKSIILIFVIGLLLQFTACKDDDFTSDSSCKISFSADTISFDTIFTDMLTATQRVVVYNNSDENIRISNIRINSEYECFQVNVNGKSGTEWKDVELLSKDSMYVFVQAKLGQLKEKDPMVVTANLAFLYNGNEQQIVLSTIGRNVCRMRNVKITADEKWGNELPYLIYDTLEVCKGATLEVEAGAELYFYSGAVMLVEGSLKMNGSEDKWIKMRGHRTDCIYDDVKYDKMVGQWGGLIFGKESSDNIINHVEIRSANFGIKIDTSECGENSKLVLSNSIIRNIRGIGLQSYNANVYAYNSEISNCQNGCVALIGGSYIFNHCTIANFPRNSRFHDALVLSNETDIPLKRADFNNSIIYGSFIKEIDFDGEDSDETFNYRFNYCMIRYEESDFSFYKNERFNNVYWNQDIYFKMLNHVDYEYDFSLDSLSAAIDVADSTIVWLFPECGKDINGKARPLGDGFDIGAYEWIKEVDETE